MQLELSTDVEIVKGEICRGAEQCGARGIVGRHAVSVVRSTSSRPTMKKSETIDSESL